MNKNKHEDDTREILGYCGYCKNPVHNDEDRVVNSGNVYHMDCWKQKNNIVEEINFDEY